MKNRNEKSAKFPWPSASTFYTSVTSGSDAFLLQNRIYSMYVKHTFFQCFVIIFFFLMKSIYNGSFIFILLIPMNIFFLFSLFSTSTCHFHWVSNDLMDWNLQFLIEHTLCQTVECNVLFLWQCICWLDENARWDSMCGQNTHSKKQEMNNCDSIHTQFYHFEEIGCHNPGNPMKQKQ